MTRSATPTTRTSTTMTKNGSKNCGCGGAGGGAGGGGGACSCGGTTFPGRPVSASVCSPCDDAAFVRPRFFAGQLLTEDDLEALNAYIVGKNRLHNARLWGEGVVCGLEVVCGPCSGATIVVRPGYALDCCGNDLVLACDRELDIGPMIAALREQIRPGHGCADPCAAERPAPEPCVPDDPAEPEEPTQPTDPGEGSSGRGGRSGRALATRATGDPRTTRTPGDPRSPRTPGDPRSPRTPGDPRSPRTPGDPRSPRATDDTRTTRATTEARIPDEFCLYLRYNERPTEPIAPLPVGDDCGAGACEPTRIVEGVTFELRCRPRDEVEEGALGRMVRVLGEVSPDGRAMKELAFLDYAAATAGPAVTRAEAGLLELDDKERATWQSWLDRLSSNQPGSEPRIELLGRFAIEVGGLSLRAGLRSETKEPTPGPDPERTALLLDEAATTLLEAPATDQPAFVTAGRQAISLHQSLRPRVPGQGPKVIEQLSYTERLYLYGWAHDVTVHRRVASSMRDVLRAVVRAVNATGQETSCGTRDEIAALPIVASEMDVIAADDVKAAVLSARRTSSVTRRFLTEQACLALLPPCPPCDDPAVLLACLKVIDCKVVEICNLERRFVWSPTALRHWLPQLSWMGTAIEDMCCDGQEPGDALGKTARRMAALDQLVEAPGIGSLAQAAYRLYPGAPRPSALTDALTALVSRGRPSEALSAPGEKLVTRRELDAIVAGLRAELGRVQSSGAGRPRE
jgi:hypothetical protein